MSLLCRPQNAATCPVRGAIKPIKVLFLGTLLSLAASNALGQNNAGQNDHNQEQNYKGGHHVSAPEIDPAQALGALTLLGGSVAIIRGYRRNKK